MYWRTLLKYVASTIGLSENLIRFSLLGDFSNIITPTTMLNSYSPSFTSPPASETVVLLDTMAAFLVGPIFLQVFLLRAKPTDITVWRAVQAVHC